jgi:hypothetical protein
MRIIAQRQGLGSEDPQASPPPTDTRTVKVGVYIDGYNLYYGGRDICGRDATGWRWLDLRGLSNRLLDGSKHWKSQGALVTRIVYCTSKVGGGHNPDGRRRQQTYLDALRQSGSVDVIEYGRFAMRTKYSPLATSKPGRSPVVTTPQWPIKVRGERGEHLTSALFMVSYLAIEEKGSDVNLTTHLLADLFQEKIDAALVITNDSDHRLPLQLTRMHIPVATINPQKMERAKDLKGSSKDGPGGHWWYSLKENDFQSCQLANPVGPHSRPAGW